MNTLSWLVRSVVVATVLAGVGAIGAVPVQSPQPLTPWTRGTLDIHHIATGRGNATFVVLPDATTLLIDAGAVATDIPYADPLPDRSRTPGAWIADYVTQFAPRPASPRLDYALVTHFHPDHFGELAPGNARSADGLGAVLGPIDVHQVNHHGSIDPASPGFLATLRSRVLIVPAWAPTHPSPDVLKRLLNPRYYPGPRDVFTLALREPMKHAIGARVAQLAADHGHVVVRVAPGGAAYSVFVLDDGTRDRAVVKTFGPYDAR
ncbi:MAG: MBL fold metallo-hydrolase [Acidobacteriota bacterium]